MSSSGDSRRKGEERVEVGRKSNDDGEWKGWFGWFTELMDEEENMLWEDGYGAALLIYWILNWVMLCSFGFMNLPDGVFLKDAGWIGLVSWMISSLLGIYMLLHFIKGVKAMGYRYRAGVRLRTGGFFSTLGYYLSWWFWGLLTGGIANNTVYHGLLHVSGVKFLIALMVLIGILGILNIALICWILAKPVNSKTQQRGHNVGVVKHGLDLVLIFGLLGSYVIAIIKPEFRPELAPGSV
ncbi:hypothetical protein NEHOM01_2155 [Nematocida homosporus]|uniref:uncharacterized protein n=1 Tax=Nematocida homosporus TaxID=1912981 RepID=UPI002220BDAA|nr:uncharacterized protein NEHOM01_2155 [Nematocida homosporus]KAI5187410.1 hypothetical protein NEHOM01_2155 [Nematocida homosporus]